jgi:FixJ family two-component response regulator
VSDFTPIVFVVDDVSVSDSLESLIGFEGWQPETFRSAREFPDYPIVHIPNWVVPTFPHRTQGDEI